MKTEYTLYLESLMADDEDHYDPLFEEEEEETLPEDDEDLDKDELLDGDDDGSGVDYRSL